MKRGRKIFLIIVVILLVLGAYFFGLFRGSSNADAVNEVNKQVDNEILDLFSEDGMIAVRDSSGEIWTVDKDCLR